MDLVNRLKFFMDSNKIAISQFADTCSIPRPTMSQILNGRNKKISDELISKIHTAYPNLSVLWLMFGEGEMTIDSNTSFSGAENNPNPAKRDNQLTDNQSSNPFILQNSAFNNDMSEKIGDTHQESTPTLITTTPQYPTDSSSKETLTGSDMTAAALIDDSYGIIDFENGDANNTTPMPPAADEASPCSDPSTLSNPTKTEPAETSNETLSSQAERAQTAPPSSISLKTEPGKHITNIVVFYSDNSFQSFYPDYPSPSHN